MRVLAIITFFAGIAASVLFCVLRIKKGGLYGLFSKAAASALFVMTAAFAAASINGASFYAPFVVAGLALGLAGDIFLDLKIVYPQHSQQYFKAGTYMFFAGHIMYLFAIFGSFEVDFLSAFVPSIAALIFTLGIVLGAPLFKLDLKKNFSTCSAYAFILAFTMCAAFSAAAATDFAPHLFAMFIAAALFVASDIILSHMYFSTLNFDTEAKFRPKDSDLLCGFNHGVYYAAQFLIAASILLI